ncbi:unnamed protein product [Adineta steineri]|uniref:Uncharacterized protein n=1 Tax=Adineta steineri TaxID=433720 RepID=A0A816D5J5_9BILA|nr:unnamed protein product [Adineta steineri]CAF1630567.1 unnamed protein product [Adineta steineri]
MNKRLQVLEKTFEIFKRRDILEERNNLINLNNSSIQSPPKSDPEFVLGVDISKFNFVFDEFTRFVRQIFRQAGYASDLNKVLENEQIVLNIQQAMKKRNQRLQKNSELLLDS